jgi:hypothetical protein
VADIKDFDKSRRTHWRSDDELERVHANLPLKARGLTPLRRGEPGYGEHMYGDGDDEACEPYVGMETGSETDAGF